jgi:hypothetical protein
VAKPTDGYTRFGSPIILDGGRRVEAWYPDSGIPDRRWMVWVCEGDNVLEEQYVRLGNNPYGPDVDDVLRLEEVTNRLVEHYGTT